MESRAAILSRLRQDILSLQGSRSPLYGSELDIKLGPFSTAFPNSTFPLSAIHEFVCTGKESIAATTGFISGLLSFFMQKKTSCIWISRNKTVYPPALKSFGISPEHIIFIEAKKEKDLLWTMEEALRCDPLAAVVCEVKEVSFIASRRLQLAVEESHVTGLIIRDTPRNMSTACDARWHISSFASETEEGLPGVGHPRWKIELLKVRNGKPGTWEVTWRNDRFEFEQNIVHLLPRHKKKTG